MGRQQFDWYVIVEVEYYYVCYDIECDECVQCGGGLKQQQGCFQ